jgi:hypothetical protein
VLRGLTALRLFQRKIGPRPGPAGNRVAGGAARPRRSA